MNITCNFVTDFVELYHENLVSPETALAIRSHLKTCTNCRNYYREYQIIKNRKSAPAVNILLNNEDISETEERLCANLSKRLRRRRFLELVGTSAVIGAGSVMLTIGLFLTFKNSDNN
ncbi:MAG: zf-HC2 domain-containing protein [Oscillospiraceae bacterium]|nr:zf-HC2 domain-containing protein [Oscillospiraceae bacterium]MDE6657445.1 zf-HC2 domain-containing protein [Oscillospiraceae bacterium]